ncbi:MerR family transcriptional regulator [Streptomyces zhaozhouensis]|nr:MerR family transcriptional regulator [Streptomyces zhaozhouensis]
MDNEPTVTIGQAAALYGLAPSTVRWWERQGLLNPPARRGGRRAYGPLDLRRIGMAYLCCVVGKMPLEQAAVVTSGAHSHADWQRTVGEQIEQLEERAEQLRAARDYLRHLLLCEDDDMARCHLLVAELAARTPQGPVPDGDLVAAARAAHRGGASRDREARDREARDGEAREERPVARLPREETSGACAGCAAPMPRNSRGRPRRYCGRACQQRAYRARRAGDGR